VVSPGAVIEVRSGKDLARSGPGVGYRKDAQTANGIVETGLKRRLSQSAK
jgi:hypothetical protein